MSQFRETIDLETGWDIMQWGINRLKLCLEGEQMGEKLFTSEEYMNMYTTIYNMCTQKPPHDYSQQLYDRYKQAFVDYIKSTVLPSFRHKNGELLMMEVVRRWENHNIMVRWLSRFFHYLDRYFISRRTLPDLKTVGLTCFKDLVYDNNQGVVTKEMISLINREREGEKVDQFVLKSGADIYKELGFGSMEYYEDDLEAYLLKDTTEYYARKASAWIVQDSCPDYMIKAEECLKKEKERVGNYLKPITEPKLLERVQHELLTEVSSQLLEKENSGCRALLRDGKVEDLSRMYRLFSRISNSKGLDKVALTFKQHVTEEGTALLNQAEDAAGNKRADKKDVVGTQENSFVRKLIELHDQYFDYVITCFANSSLFHKSLKEAFEVFCNKTVAGNSTAELLTVYSDSILRGGGSQKLTDEAVEEELEKVVKLLAFVSDKDLFAEFHRKKLSRRLLNNGGDKNEANNLDNERSILSKLKQNYGAQFTSKMEGMINDVVLAKENQENFEKHPTYKTTGKVDFRVQALTTGFWPTYKAHDINLPSEMVKCVEVFREYYKTTTKSRKLTWLYSMGQCNVTGYFTARSLELTLSPFQACVLLLFNASERLSFQEILLQLNLSEEEVKRNLHSLSCNRYKIIAKSPDNKSISTDDVFEFNPKFTNNSRKFKVPVPPILDEKKKVVEDVDKDRKYSIDACLVRIMKSRKVLGYQLLVTECVEQLNRMFKPDVRQIKKRIEDLITRDYLERDAENPNTFKYVA